jgi:hypothetical protein
MDTLGPQHLVPPARLNTRHLPPNQNRADRTRDPNQLAPGCLVVTPRNPGLDLSGTTPRALWFKDPLYSALSNLSLHNIIINGNSFRSAEHYFQSRKHLPDNKPHALLITLAPGTFKATTLGG